MDGTLYNSLNSVWRNNGAFILTETETDTMTLVSLYSMKISTQSHFIGLGIGLCQCEHTQKLGGFGGKGRVPP